MRYGSVCSGIEAASVAWESLGWQPAWFAEIEPFPSAVLTHHWPHVTNYGDMTKLEERILSGEIEAPDILVGGTPCQAFSVAGLRGSLDDARGNLTLVLIRILNAIDTVRDKQGKQPAILVWENVPGVLSTKDNAFGSFLGGLAGEQLPLEPAGKKWTNAGAVFGHHRKIAWRTLDAQFFGVAQRRKRVFVVASAGGVNPAEILFERQGEDRDFKTRGSAGEKVTAYAEGCLASGKSVTGTILANCGDKQFLGNQEAFSGDFFVVHGRQDPCVSDKAYAIDCQSAGNTNVLCINGSIINKSEHSGGNGLGVISDAAYTLTSTDRHAVFVDVAATLTTGFGGRGIDAQQIVDGNCVINHPHIRRLTPLECERLQGFPDNHTLIPWRGKQAIDCPDGARYKAIGNSMAVPVMYWVGGRINDTT